MTLRFETLPLTTNRLYGFANGRRYLRKEAAQNKQAIAWEARSQFKGEPMTGSLSVSVTTYWPTARRHDVDNTKGLFDALTGIVWLDDDQIVDLDTHKRIDRKNPRVEMTVQYA